MTRGLCKSWRINSNPITQVDVQGTDVEATFCSLGDRLCSGRECDSAIASRCCMAWGKFRKLLPVLTSMHHLMCVGRCAWVVATRLYSTVVKPGDQTTWTLSGFTTKTVICWICGTKVQDESPSASLLKRLGIKDITAVFSSGWLRRYGHVQRATFCIKSVTDSTLPGPRGKVRPRKTWSECVKTDIRGVWSGWHWPTRQRLMESQCSTWPSAANSIGWDTDSTLI